MRKEVKNNYNIGLLNDLVLLVNLINERLRLYTYDAKFGLENRREFELPDN